jgi:hypothetical protein
MKKEPVPKMQTDIMIPRHICDWKDKFQPDMKGGLAWYTDNSKTNKGTGAGVMVMVQG